jgi:pyrimidine operon attenuation protein/uracil phosphoribosyltransferase
MVYPSGGKGNFIAMRLLMDAEAMRRAVIRMAHEIAERNQGTRDLLLVGIERGGVPLAARLAHHLEAIDGMPVPAVRLNIGPWRDDRRSGPRTTLGVVSHDRVVVLVDDVLFTGRSVRAALDAISENGRPRRVQLAVLVDRGHRELPIRADFVGKNVPTSRHEAVVVSWDDPIGVFLTTEDGTP